MIEENEIVRGVYTIIDPASLSGSSFFLMLEALRSADRLHVYPEEWVAVQTATGPTLDTRQCCEVVIEMLLLLSEWESSGEDLLFFAEATTSSDQCPVR